MVFVLIPENENKSQENWWKKSQESKVWMFFSESVLTDLFLHDCPFNSDHLFPASSALLTSRTAWGEINLLPISEA